MGGCSETICLIDTAPIKTFPRPSLLPCPKLFSAPETFFDPANPPCHAAGVHGVAPRTPNPATKGEHFPLVIPPFMPTVVISCFSYQSSPLYHHLEHQACLQ